MKDKIEKEILSLEAKMQQATTQAKELVKMRDEANTALSSNIRLQIAVNAQIVKLRELLDSGD